MERKTHRIFGGVTLILLAVMLIISKLGYFREFKIWSLIFTIFFIIIIVKSIRPLNFAGILFPIAFLCIIYDKQLNIEKLTPGTVLAVAALGTIGLSMIFHGRSNHIHHKSNEYKSGNNINIIDYKDESTINDKISFSGSVKYINSDDFKQADFECTFGGLEVYFDKAHIKEGKAIVRINANFSGVKLYVPKNWSIEDNIETTISAVDFKNKNEPDGSETLVLIGNINFSGIEIVFI